MTHSIIMLSDMLTIVMFSFIMLNCITECVVVLELQYAEWCYTECHDAECRGAILVYERNQVL